MKAAKIQPGFQQLRWRFTAVYLTTTVIVMAAVLVFACLFGMAVISTRVLEIYAAERLRRVAAGMPEVSPNRDHQLILEAWLTRQAHSVTLKPDGADDYRLGLALSRQHPVCMSVADIAGNPLLSVSYPSARQAHRTPITVSPHLQAQLQRAAISGSDVEACVTRLPQNVIVATAPSYDRAHRVRNVVTAIIPLPENPLAYVAVIFTNWLPEIILTSFMMLGGALLFGWVVAGWLTRRLQHITRAAACWSQGDFSAVSFDGSADELGILARRLDSMALELRQFITLKEEISTVAERNRLAGDLHDTIKQEVFALSMQICVALSRMDDDPAAAKTHLLEADRIALHARQELTALIRELGNLALSEAPAWQQIEQYMRAWAQRQRVTLAFYLDTGIHEVERHGQVLLRIFQGALANVARHSGANTVTIRIAHDADGLVSVHIIDDGKGFDLEETSVGTGLTIMRARAEALPGGSFQIHSTPGAGTTVTISFQSRMCEEIAR